MPEKKEGIAATLKKLREQLKEFYHHNVRYFTHSPEEDLILAVNYLRAGIKAGKSPDLIIQELADHSFGAVSRIFRKANDSGKPARIALMEYSKGKISSQMKEFINCILNDYKGFEKMSFLLTSTLVQDKKSDLEAAVKKLDVIANWLVMMPLLAIGVLISNLLNDALGQIPPEAGLNFPTQIIPGAFLNAVLITGCAILVVLVGIMKVRIKW